MLSFLKLTIISSSSIFFKGKLFLLLPISLKNYCWSVYFLVNPVQTFDPLKRPFRDVFIWAVLSNRIAMAKLMWIMGREQIPSALMATRLLKSMASKSASDDTITDISVELCESAAWVSYRDECAGPGKVHCKIRVCTCMGIFGIRGLTKKQGGILTRWWIWRYL